MQTSRTLVIRYSKSKIVGLALLTLPFVALFAYAVVHRYRPDSRYPADLMRLVGVLGAIGFGSLLLYLVVKLFDRAAGLVLDAQGFIDGLVFAMSSFFDRAKAAEGASLSSGSDGV